MKKSISTDLTPANVAAVLALLGESPSRLQTLGKSLSEAQQRQPLGAGERSFVQDVAHLLNCEATSSEAVYLAILSNEPSIADVHPERQLGKLLRFDQLPLEELLAYFGIRRKVLLGVLTSLKEKDWARTVKETNKRRKESVYWKARSIAVHEVEHLSDLEAKVRHLRSAAQS